LILATPKYRLYFDLRKPFSYDSYHYGFPYGVAICGVNRCAKVRKRLSLPQAEKCSGRKQQQFFIFCIAFLALS